MIWEQKSLDELGFVGRGKSKHRPRDAVHLYGGPYPFIQTGDVKRAHLYIAEYSQTYSEAGLAQSKLWKPGTLCITIAANIAETAILGIDACFPDSIIGFIPDDDKADVRYVKYLFDTLKKRYQQFSQGATQDNLSRKKLLSLKFPVPPLPVQKDIASTLSAYDDLIENNRRRIALLEEAARLLYREWFVHLRFPGHEHTSVVDGVPQGWERTTISEVSTVNELSLRKGFQGEIEYVDISSVNPGRISRSQIVDFEKAPGRARRVVRHGDVIWSCVRPSRRSHAVIWNPPDNLIVSTGFAVLTPRLIPTSYLYYFTTTQDFVGYLANNAKGVAYPAVTAKDFKIAEIVIPPSKVLNNFDQQVRPTFELLAALEAMSIRLKQARDLLLPRLMNGRIAV